jgi:alkylated DNA repair dioxygenase AlkB
MDNLWFEDAACAAKFRAREPALPISMAMSAYLQPSLFEPPRSSTPQGLRYAPNVISEAEERALLAEVVKLDFTPFQFRGFTGNRRTASFGWRYDFNGGGFQSAAPMPDFLLALRETAAALADLPAETLVQTSVIEYRPAAGIGWHRDRPQFGVVIGLSLLARCRFRLRRALKEGWERAALDLAPRSAYVLAGEAREAWQHSIPPLDTLRYSVTFRTLSPSGAHLVQR